ncbi:hypothetical protein MPNTM1_03347 [Mycolicibacterium parafortuitum]|uniref:PP2C family protein-serine/threonine phosphatase n=1 Tax=Mycolicibacterium parafortuitum TaxID=39692 RepID=UPI0032C44D56
MVERSEQGLDAISTSGRHVDTDEQTRLRALQRYRVVDAAPGTVLGRIAGLAARATGAPMAVVSIVDDDHVRLISTYGVRVTSDRSARDDPVLGDVATADHVDVIDADPRLSQGGFLTDHRVRFYAAAPIVTFDGQRLGAVAVMDTESRGLSAEHTAVLTDLAAVVMDQLELRQTSLDALDLERRLRDTADEARRERDQAQADRGIAERDRDAIEEFATALQRTLLPPSLPRIGGLASASYFRPISARQIGGDFYDLFSLGGDRWAFFIGDVLGHGVDAAVVTSLIRYTLRAAALHYADPIDVLAELNSVLLREVAPRRFCTVVFGTLEPAADGAGFSVALATGGHPPALLVSPDGGAPEAVRPQEGMLVGALTDAVFGVLSLTLRPGQILMFYTDGLIEARMDEMRFDEEALAAFVGQRAGRGLTALMDDISTLATKLDQRDDIAVLALEVADPAR